MPTTPGGYGAAHDGRAPGASDALAVPRDVSDFHAFDAFQIPTHFLQQDSGCGGGAEYADTSYSPSFWPDFFSAGKGARRDAAA
jgi:hypothetical protein